MNEWKPIKSAPKNGKSILLIEADLNNPNCYIVRQGRWKRKKHPLDVLADKIVPLIAPKIKRTVKIKYIGYWITIYGDYDFKPTHWMPIHCNPKDTK